MRRVLVFLRLPRLFPLLLTRLVRVSLPWKPVLLVPLFVRVRPGEPPRPPPPKVLKQDPLFDVLLGRVRVPLRPVLVTPPRALSSLGFVKGGQPDPLQYPRPFVPLVIFGLFFLVPLVLRGRLPKRPSRPEAGPEWAATLTKTT